MIGIAVCLLLVALALLAADGMRDRLNPVDFAVVLGTRVERDGTPSMALQARLDRATELYHAGYFPTVVVSGGIGKEGFDEAAVMKTYLVLRGVPASNVITDAEGANTWASARNARRLADEQGYRTVMVISQYYHVSRSRLAMRRFGFAHVSSGHARLYQLRDAYSLSRELAGYAWYWLRKAEV